MDTIFKYSKYPIELCRKCHKLVHNGRFPKFEVLYCRESTIKSTKTFQDLSYQVQSSRSQSFKTVEKS